MGGQSGFNSMNMDDIFSQFGDIFGGAFGGFGGFGGSQGRRVMKGSNLRVRVNLTLEEICNGVEKKIKVKRKVLAPGATFSTCSQCNGAGQVTRVTNTILGRMQTSTTCPACSGSGQALDNRPSGSDANGMIIKEETVKIPIPAGVVDDMQLKVSGKGNEAPGNGISGDLLVVINEVPHKKLQREGDNLHYELYVSIPDAILGTDKEIETVSGKVRIKIEAGQKIRDKNNLTSLLFIIKFHKRFLCFARINFDFFEFFKILNNKGITLIFFFGKIRAHP